MPKIPMIKAKELLRYLLKYGCIEKRVNGSHHILQYNNKITVLAVHNEDNKRGTFSGILKQLEIDINDFIEFIDKN